MNNRYLVLEDGTILEGKAVGASCHHVVSELVFNTSMTGYQEIISDPSYFGQSIVFTNPLMGNYGINRDDFEAVEPCLDGVVFNSLAPLYSNFRAQMSLDEFLRKKKIPAICDLDTRYLVLKIRELGSMKMMLVDTKEECTDALETIKKTPLRNDHTKQVMTKRTYEIPSTGKRIVLMDFGVKLNIIHSLVKRQCSLIVVPGDTDYETILSFSPDGILISNGPGDPSDNVEAIENIKKLIESDTPIFGICLGHQLISLASGAKTYKMKFGHHGANQPVVDLETGKTEITSQNHGYAVDEKSLEGTGLVATHINLNDKTIEGVKSTTHPVFSVQFHPEAAAGPHDAGHLLDRFLSVIDRKEPFKNA